jgi:hypothetical protein
LRPADEMIATLWLVLHILITIIGGAAAVGLIRLQLTLAERLLVGVSVGFVLGTAMSFLVALSPGGLSPLSIYGGPIVLGAIAFILGRTLRIDIVESWRVSWDQARDRWRGHRPWGMLAVALGFTLAFVVVFWFAMQDHHGALETNYAVVWADWAHHLTRASGLAFGHNITRLEDPLYAGTALHYPFLSNFDSAEWMKLGVGPGGSFQVLGAILCTVIALAVVCLSLRLGTGLLAGTLAAIILFIGGGLGFSQIASDSCLKQHQSTIPLASREYTKQARDKYGCTLMDLATSPVKLTKALAGVPSVVAAQPEPYDGLDASNVNQTVLSDYQWHTPLFAVWVNQAATWFGFITALSVLLLIVAAVKSQERQWGAFGLAGLMLGLMLWFQIHVMFALLIALPIYALWRRRKEWIAFFGATAWAALPRFIELAGDPHGSAQYGNQFPTIEPGWLYNPTAAGLRGPLSLHRVVSDLGTIVTLPANPHWWGFWIVNLGTAVPLCAGTVFVLAATHSEGRLADVARRIISPLPRELVCLVVPFFAVFVLSNIVVYQSWDYDNSKVFIYWFLSAALLIGAVAEALMRRWWRGAIACILIFVTIATGVLSVLRLLPWTPSVYRGGPYTFVTAQDRALAEKVAAITPGGAVFVTPTDPDDPLLIIGGRTTILGYYGWLWSYGTVFGPRLTDVPAILHGCSSIPPNVCPVQSLLRKYAISYVEIDTRYTSTENENPRWWATSGYPLIASDSNIFVYDVRNPPAGMQSSLAKGSRLLAARVGR